MNAVARLNYLHARYRKAGKILDAGLLHALGDGALEVIHVVDDEAWRTLSDIEKCAIGVFSLRSWRRPGDTVHAVEEL